MGGDDDDDLEGDIKARDITRPQIVPFIAAGGRGETIHAKESIMPKGVYDRSKAKPRSGPTPGAVAPLAPIPAAAATKKRAKKPGSAVARARAAAPAPVGQASRFDVAVDLRVGAVTVNAKNGSLKLERDEVLALFGFMAGRSA